MDFKPTEIVEASMLLPRSLDTRIHLRLVIQAKTISIFLTTASQDELSSAKPMGSFVYALPNVRTSADALKILR